MGHRLRSIFAQAWPRRLNRSLSVDLTIGMLVILAFIEGAFLFAIYERQSAAMLEDLELKAEDYAAKLSEVLAVPIWDFDDEQIEKVGRGFLQNELMARLRIVNSQGDQILILEKTESGGPLIARSAAIDYDGRAIGRVDIAIATTAYTREILWLRNVLLVVFVCSVLVFFVASGLLLRFFLRKPLTALARGMDRIAEGDFDRAVQHLSYTELTGIAMRFEQMASRIKDREQTLVAMNQELQQVNDRLRQARDMLRRSEERFREMAEMLPETIFEMDADGRLSYVNRNGLKQFGYSSGDLAKGLLAFDMFAETEHPRLHRNIQAILSGRAARLKEFQALHRDGTRFPTLVSSSPIRKSGRIVGIRGFVIDISDKKDLEERLRKASRMEAIGNLAAGVAHDLNNILSGLIGYPDLLLLDLPADSPMRAPVETIKQTGQKAAAVVQDLLTLARRNIAETRIVDLNGIVRDYLEAPEFTHLPQHRADIALTLALADDLMNVKASAHHLSKGLMNLVVNAMEAMPAGGRLEIRTANCYTDKAYPGYETIPEGEYVVLSVIDAGIGIPREDLRNIFEPFYTKKRLGRSGTGLGMSVVWATVKDHGGFVDVDSEEGRGTRFDLYFPATREKTAPRPTRVPIDDYLGSERILVVDDVPEQRRIAADMLERLGYAVQTVASGEAAVDRIRREPPDLLILDMVMEPGIDGLETYRRVLALVPDQKAIIASGFAENERVKSAMAMGVRAYLKKPYTLENLGLSVRAALDRPAKDSTAVS